MCFFLQESIFWPNGQLSPRACHTYSETYLCNGLFEISWDIFSASYEASELCLETAYYILQHLRLCHLLNLQLDDPVDKSIFI